MQIAPGTRLGRYEIRSKLGAGGMGEVYLAEDTQLRRQVALKILSADLASHNDRMRRFVQEAQAAAALNHPNIAHIYEIGETGGVNFIAMEFIEGQTFRRLIHGREPDSKKVLRCLRQVAEGLAKAHAAGIVHRDLKPDNIMITNDGFAKILDFGLAKLVESQRPLGLSSDPFLPLLTIITHTVMTTASLVAAPRTTAISGSGALVVAGTFFHAYKKTGALPQSPAASVTPNEFGTYCFDLKGKQLWADKFKGYEGVYCVAMSDDGTIAASGGWDTNHPLAGFVRAYSTKRDSAFQLPRGWLKDQCVGPFGRWDDACWWRRQSLFPPAEKRACSARRLPS